MAYLPDCTTQLHVTIGSPSDIFALMTPAGAGAEGLSEQQREDEF